MDNKHLYIKQLDLIPEDYPYVIYKAITKIRKVNNYVFTHTYVEDNETLTQFMNEHLNRIIQGFINDNCSRIKLKIMDYISRSSSYKKYKTINKMLSDKFSGKEFENIVLCYDFDMCDKYDKLFYNLLTSL